MYFWQLKQLMAFKIFANKIFIYFAILPSVPNVFAGSAPLAYNVGPTFVSESQQQILVHASSPISVSILPGGATWPRMSLDEAARIYIGNVVVDATTSSTVRHRKATLVLAHGVEITAAGSGFRFRSAGKNCFFSLERLGLDKRRTALESLKHSNIAFSSAATGLLVLVTQFGADGRVSNYRVEELDLDQCQISFRHDVGNPDLLVELGHSSEGGWWLTGSIEQTLLQSADGRTWRKAALPKGLGSLISAYVANPREIWLAAILSAAGAESPYPLVYSNDSGRSWRNVVANDPVLDRLPVGWLEGQKRRVQK
jgi:hypothetical protein